MILTNQAMLCPGCHVTDRHRGLTNRTCLQTKPQRWRSGHKSCMIHRAYCPNHRLRIYDRQLISIKSWNKKLVTKINENAFSQV